MLLYQTGGGGLGTRLLWFDRDGKPSGAVGEPDFYNWPVISPDGKQVAVSINDIAAGGNRDIWIFDLAGQKTRLTFDPSNEVTPVWSPDGIKVYFTSDRKGQDHIYNKAADGSGVEETVLESGMVSEQARSISPDGRYLAYIRTDSGTKSGLDIWVLPLFGERKPFPIVATEFTDVNPAISPEGKWMAYSNTETGQFQVYLTPFPGGGPKWQVSTTGGSSPHWRGDGKELYFVSNDHQYMMAVDVTLGGATPKLGMPKQLFQTATVTGPSGPFDVIRDGKKFLGTPWPSRTTTRRSPWSQTGQPN